MKPRIVQQLILLTVGVLLLSACRPRVPKEYIQPDEMEDLLYDYYVAQSMPGDPQSKNNTEYDRQYHIDLVLKKYGRTQAELDSSLKYYYINLEDLYEIYGNVQKRLSEQALELGATAKEVERFTTRSLSGDTAEVWEGARQMALIPQPPYNIVQFSQKADTAYHQGDSFLMTFDSNFLVQSGSKNAYLVLSVYYENDSIITQNTTVSQMGTTNLRIPVCDLKVKEFRGSVYMPKRQNADNAGDMCVLLLNHIQLVRFHHKKPTAALSPTATEPQKQDTLKRDTIVADSLKPHRHRLGERPVPVKSDDKKPIVKSITK